MASRALRCWLMLVRFKCVQADIEDKESRLPPRLGRHRFQPAPPQVLTSDNVTGSLRKLRTVPRVAKDRFQSLQKRGVIQVRAAAYLSVLHMAQSL